MTGLYTDLYELRMVESYVERGMTGDATFSLYIRPTQARPWFVALGAERVARFIESYRFDGPEIDYLRTLGFRDVVLDWLRELEATGELFCVPDGTVVLAEEPIVEFTAPLPVGQLVETAVINLVQYSTMVATKAARAMLAADGRPVVDFGFRRAHGLETGVEAARAAYAGGGLQTSNVEAGRRYGIGVVGTMAHAFVQAHPDELSAFRAFAADHPDGTVLLVDTYDTLDGVRHAVVVAREMRERGKALAAIRLDSGDLVRLSIEARAILDEAGFEDVRIFASGGLDEFQIADLVRADAAIDAFGVGTDLVTSGDRPSLEIAYKLVSYDGRPVVKRSAGKASLPGAKQVFRRGPIDDVLALRDEHLEGRALLERVRSEDLATVRERARAELEQLPDELRDPRYGGEIPRPRRSEALREVADRLAQG